MKNKGFTLVEMLAVLVILGLLIGIGVFTVSNIKDNAEKNYYVSMEDTLKIAGNDYFNDNREDRPIDDYNFVSLETLEEHSYLDSLKTYDKKENCDKSSGVYIYNTENGNEYEVCLKCGIHKSTGLYCNGNKTGQIMITGSTNTGGFYNPTLSYAGTPWTNASSVNITFTLMGEDVTADKFEIYNGNNDKLDGTCTSIIDNSCTKNISVTGSYYVVAYDGTNKVGNRKYFNVKIDNMAPTFDIKDIEEEKDLENKYEYPYNNEVINIHDDNGYKSVVFSLKELVDSDPSIDINNKDLTASNLRILENLQSGKYLLTVTVTDYARNATTKTLEFTVKYNVNMVYFDNNEKRHDIGTIRVYKNGKYEGLLSEINVNGNNTTVNWYDNTDYGGDGYTSSTPVDKTSTHTLYGRESRSKIPVSDEPHCNRDNDFTYDNTVQELVTEQTGYHLINHRQKNAGTYTIIAMPDANYTWADNTRTYKIIQCTIKRYKVTIPNEPCVGGLIYNGSNQVLIKNEYGGASGKIQALTPSKDLYTFSPITGKNAGTYDVDFNLPDKTNLEWTDGTQNDISYNCKIAKYSIDAPTDPCKQGLVYNKNSQILIKDGYGTHHGYGSDGVSTAYTQKKTSFDEVIYQATPDSGISAGTHNVSFILADTSNFEWTGGATDVKTFPCTIGKAPVTWETDRTLIYSGYTAHEQALVLTMISSLGDHISLRLVPTTVHSDHVYNANVNFAPGTSAETYAPNYYITNPNPTIGFTNDSVTITADSDSRAYNGNALTKNSSSESGSIAANGETYTATVTGTITNVGSVDNVVSNAVIKSGSHVTTNYYDINYVNGTLTVTLSKTATTGSCNSSAIADGSSSIVTGGNHVTYTNNTTTSSGNNTVTVTPQANYAWSDGTTGSKSVTCNVPEPCTWDWRYSSTSWNVSNCSESNNGSVKYVCVDYDGSPWTSSLTVGCVAGSMGGGNFTGDTAAEAKNKCENGKTSICNNDCGAGNVMSCTCSAASGTSKTKRDKYVYSCE